MSKFCWGLIVAAAPALALAQANPTAGAAMRQPATAKSSTDEAKKEEPKKEEATKEEAKKEGAKPADAGTGKPVEAFAQFGFAPALYLLHYKQPVFKDSKDVRLRSDGVIAADGSRVATSLGVEVHYGFSTYNKAEYGADGKIKSTSGHTYSPYVGMFDLDDGVNGLALGLMYTYWRGNENYDKTSALSIGVGWTVHKNRLVLAEGLKEGVAPPTGLAADDYTRRKDVKGMTLTISASFGF